MTGKLFRMGTDMRPPDMRPRRVTLILASLASMLSGGCSLLFDTVDLARYDATTLSVWVADCEGCDGQLQVTLYRDLNQSDCGRLSDKTQATAGGVPLALIADGEPSYDRGGDVTCGEAAFAVPLERLRTGASSSATDRIEIWDDTRTLVFEASSPFTARRISVQEAQAVVGSTILARWEPSTDVVSSPFASVQDSTGHVRILQPTLQGNSISVEFPSGIAPGAYTLSLSAAGEPRAKSCSGVATCNEALSAGLEAPIDLTAK
jgi:hypothetical protein